MAVWLEVAFCCQRPRGHLGRPIIINGVWFVLLVLRAPISFGELNCTHRSESLRATCRLCFTTRHFRVLYCRHVFNVVGGAHERRGTTAATTKQSAVNILHITQSYYRDDLMRVCGCVVSMCVCMWERVHDDLSIPYMRVCICAYSHSTRLTRAHTYGVYHTLDFVRCSKKTRRYQAITAQ